MKIKEYPELNFPCCEYDPIYSSCDVVPTLKECDIISDAINKLTNSDIGLNLNYLDLSIIEDFKDFIYNAIHYKAQCTLIYNELIFDFNYTLYKKGINSYVYSTPDGLFVSMEDYQKWQDNYFIHPIKPYEEKNKNYD